MYSKSSSVSSYQDLVVYNMEGVNELYENIFVLVFMSDIL